MEVCGNKGSHFSPVLRVVSFNIGAKSRTNTYRTIQMKKVRGDTRAMPSGRKHMIDPASPMKCSLPILLTNREAPIATQVIERPARKYPLTVLLLDFHMAKKPMHMTRIKYRATMAMSAVSSTALILVTLRIKVSNDRSVRLFIYTLVTPAKSVNHT